MKNKCLICKNNIESIIDFWNFPYSCWTIYIPEKNKKYNFNIWLCKKCWLIQQYNIPDPNILYSITSHEWVWLTWENHYKESAEYIINKLSWNNNVVLEIWWWSWKIIDKIYESDKIDSIIVTDFKYRWNLNHKLTVIDWLFEEIDLWTFNWKVDLIYSSHVFEHISNFKEHLEKCNTLLKNDWELIIFLPNFKLWIENNFLNAFVQEHNIYPTIENIKQILENNWLNINDIYYYWNHSIYISAKKSLIRKNTCENNLYENNLKLLKEYKNYLNLLSKEYIKNIWEKSFYIFWAHIFSQILLFNSWLNINKCKWIFDNASFKQNKFLYWTDIKVYNPIKIWELNNEIIIVNAWSYTNEIKEQILEINNSIKII